MYSNILEFILSICEYNVDLYRHNTISSPLQLVESELEKILLHGDCTLGMDALRFWAMLGQK